MQGIRPSKLILTILLAVAVWTTAAAPTNAPPNTLVERIEKARAEKQIDRRLQTLAGLANELSPAEISPALKAADQLPSLREQLAFRDSVLKRWGELAPAEAFAHVAPMSENLSKVEAIRNIASIYARSNAPAAATAALKLTPGRARTEAISITAEGWARINATHALKWANELPESPLKHTALRSIYFVWVHSDPAAASAVVQKLSPGDVKNALLINIAQNWAVTDPQAAIAWAEALPAGSERDLAIVIATESWADSDPRAALDFALKLKPSDLRLRAALVALERWATQDPRQAFDRAKDSADRQILEQGIERVLNVCGPVCPEAAGEWVEKLPAGDIRDRAIEAYVETVHVWHPKAAARLAVQAQNPAVRERNIEKALTLWLKLDPDAAKRWLAKSELPDEAKQRFASLQVEQDF